MGYVYPSVYGYEDMRERKKTSTRCFLEGGEYEKTLVEIERTIYAELVGHGDISAHYG